MRPLGDDGFVCEHCGHSAQPRLQQFRCSCPHCKQAAEVAVLVDSAPSPNTTDDPRQMEILHSLNLLTLGEAVDNSEMEAGEVEIKPDAEIQREVDIKKQLVALYQEQKAYAHPTPAEQPNDYEPEEVESWANLRARIEALENELARINGKHREPAQQLPAPHVSKSTVV